MLPVMTPIIPASMPICIDITTISNPARKNEKRPSSGKADAKPTPIPPIIARGFGRTSGMRYHDERAASVPNEAAAR